MMLEIANSRMKVLPNSGSEGVYGFTLSKNGGSYEFTTKNESVFNRWITSLKSICVLAPFHEQYKAVKMIGKGSFAKVYFVENKNDGKSYAVKAFTKEGIYISNKENAKVIGYCTAVRANIIRFFVRKGKHDQ